VTLFFIKIGVTISIVLGLSVIAERLSPRWAGMLGGYPLGVAIALIFVAIEQGTVFAGVGAIHTLVALAANISIFATYGLCLSLWPRCPFYAATGAGLVSFFSFGYGLSLISFDLKTAFVFTGSVVVCAVFAFRRFQDMTIKQAVKLSPWVALIRAVVACAVVLTVTGLASVLGPQLSGVLSGFPSTVLPLVIILHVTYGPAPVLALIKHFPKGVVSTILFSGVYAAFLIELGVLWTTLLAFAVATVYLFALQYFQQGRT